MSRAADELPVTHLERHEIIRIADESLLEELRPGTNVFRTGEEWQRFWAAAKIPPPKVDFRTNAAAVAFAGMRPSSGYDVRIEKVRFETKTGRLEVQVVGFKPGPGGAFAQAIVYPIDVAVFPKPSGSIGSIKVIGVERVTSPRRP